MKTNQIETKVTAATFASASVGLVLWILATYVFGAEVPEPVAGFVSAVVPAVVTFLAGYAASHTPRDM